MGGSGCAGPAVRLGLGPAARGGHTFRRGIPTVRRLLLLLLALALLDVVLLLAGGRGPPAPEGDRVRAGIVFDVGGRGDKSFNDLAFLGLVRARDELGVEVEYVEPGEGADREGALRMLAARGFDLVVGVGFIFSDDIVGIAREYPDTAFACVDFAVPVDPEGRPVPPPPNVAGLKFREQEGAFLVGAAAALVSRTGRVGFVGGMDIPLIRKFEAGYRAGVRQVCPACTVIVNYAGVTGAAFKDPGKGKELALAQYGNGVDVIFHASGSTGLGVFEAARLTGGLAIGVDADQSSEAPGHVLTSMVKGVDVAVYRMVQEVVEQRFEGGIRTLGLAEGGVGYVHGNAQGDLLPDGVVARVEDLRERIVRGEILVPERPGVP